MESSSSAPRARLRRSQRLPLVIPVIVSSLDPNIKYSERCESLSVNSYGCGLRASRPLDPGTPVRLQLVAQHEGATNAHVVMCKPLDPEGKAWELGIEFDIPENFWGIHFPPEDWAKTHREEAREERAAAAAPPSPATAPAPAAVSGVAPEAAPPELTVPPVAAAPAPAAVPAPTALAAPPTPAPEPTPAPAAVVPPPAAAPEPAPVLAPPPAPEVKPAAPPEVTISLAEIAAAPSGAVAAPLSLGDILKLFDLALRDHARTVSAEFEKDYQQRLGELLLRLRADLEERATADWERLRQQAQQSVLEAAGQVRQQLEQEQTQRAEARAAVAAHLEEVHKARDYIESLLRLLPQSVDQRLQEGVAAALERLPRQLEEEAATRGPAQLERLQQQLVGLADQVGSDLRQKLFEEFDRFEREFLDRINVRLEEARAAEGSLRAFGNQSNAELALRSEQALADQRAQLEELFARRREEIIADLEARRQQLRQAAESALRTLGEQVWASLKQQLRADFGQRSEQLQQALHTAQGETARLEARAEKLASRLDTNLETGLDQAVADAVARARTELDSVLASLQKQQLGLEQAAAETLVRTRAELDTERAAAQKQRQDLEQGVADTLVRARTELDNVLASLQKQQLGLEQAAAETLARARTELERAAAMVREASFAQMQEGLAPLISRGQATSEGLRAMLEALPKEQARWQQAVLDTLGRARAELERAADSIRQSHLVKSRQDLEPLLSRAELTADDLHETLASLQKEQARLEQGLADNRARAQQELERLAEFARQTYVARTQEHFDRTLAPVLSRADTTAEELQQTLQALEKKQIELGETVNEIMVRARQEMERTYEAARQARLAQAQADLDRSLAPLLSRAELTAGDLHQTLESLYKESARLEDLNAAARQELEQVRVAMTRETQQFHKVMHDALIEASGQIKGRIHQAVEMAGEPMERRLQEARAQLDTLAAGKHEELQQRLEQVRQRLEALAAQLESSVAASLDARLAEALARFQQDASRLAQASMAEWQTALNEALESIARILRDKLSPRP